MTERIVFITGGARSGKSAYAEKLALRLAKKEKQHLHYVACGVAMDKEMQTRIARHKKDRKEQEVSWKTWEQPTELFQLASRFTACDAVLVDCLTTLAANYQWEQRESRTEEILQYIQRDITCLKKKAGNLILVSNEVLQGGPHDDLKTKEYQYLLGKLHQYIVQQSDAAVLVESGIPMIKKGSLP